MSKAKAQICLAEKFFYDSRSYSNNSGRLDPRRRGTAHIKCYDGIALTGNLLSDMTLPVLVWDPNYGNTWAREILEDAVFTSRRSDESGYPTPEILLWCSCSENIYSPTEGQDRNPIIDQTWPIGSRPGVTVPVDEVSFASDLLDEVEVSVEGGSSLSSNDATTNRFSEYIDIPQGTNSIHLVVSSEFGTFEGTYTTTTTNPGPVQGIGELDFTYSTFRYTGSSMPSTSSMNMPDLIVSNTRFSRVNPSGTPYLFEFGSLSDIIETENAESAATCQEIANRLMISALNTLIPTVTTIMNITNPGWTPDGVIQCLNSAYVSGSPSGIAHNSSIADLQTQIDNLSPSNDSDLDSVYVRG